MNADSILLEAVVLSDEILELGAGEGRGVRLASLVGRLNESMMRGNTPHSWIPPQNLSSVLESLPPPAFDLPHPEHTLDWSDFHPHDAIPDEAELIRAWDALEYRKTESPPPDSDKTPDITLKW